MNALSCCRTCLSDQNLQPMFLRPEFSEKYSSVILLITGVKVEMNDSLPQEMCSTCITFINKSVKFRKMCEHTQKQLANSANNIKNEPVDIKTEENHIYIDINDYIDNDMEDVHDVTLDAPQSDNGNNCSQMHARTVSGYTDKSEHPVNLLSESDKKKHGVRVQRKSDGDREKERIECGYCHKILTSKLSLRNHFKIHTGFDVVCEHCGKKFITRRLLLMHCRAKHGYEKTDKCSFCDYKASNAEQVKIHERLHTGEKPFVCKDCNAGFHRKSSYLQHIAIHLPEKTVQCDQCPARFKSVTLMRIHKNRHRPSQYTYKCNICDNTFARRRNVSRHLQRVHGLLPAPDSYIHRVKIH